MRILVTGGAGFIGSHIVDQLVDAGHDVRILDLLLPLAHSGRPDYVNPAAEFTQGDVGDAAAAADAVDGVDAVCHQAAMVGLGVDLLAARRFAGRLVLASSMVVYGEGRYTCPSHGDVAPGPRRVRDLDARQFEPRCPACAGELTPAPVREGDRLDPRNVYAATKLHQEHLCGAFARETGASVAALRYHNVYGPRIPRNTPYAGVASIFASSLAAGDSPRVFEDGGQMRDFVHVRDVARANLAALIASDLGPDARAYNVASGTPRSIIDLARALTDAHGEDAPRPLVTGQYRLGDVRHVFASAQRAGDELGFAATEDFDAGMAEFARAPLRAAA
jgi:dTDP-L-rhamnose 4-epimerase